MEKAKNDIKSNDFKISKFDYYLASRICNLANEKNETIKAILALLTSALNKGSICLNLEQIAGQHIYAHDNSLFFSMPLIRQLTEIINNSPLVHNGSENAPLVVDKFNFIYLDKYWKIQDRLVAFLLNRAGKTEKTLNTSSEIILQSKFSCLTGGPGSGKTTKVTKILIGLLEKDPQLKILLLAPTGKAAARLKESICKNLHIHTLSDKSKSIVLPTQVFTIHKALHINPSKSLKSPFNENNPLLYDIIILDEASMVDIVLMEKLFCAISAKAKIIIIGDRNQLNSIAPGSVLADICKGITENNSKNALSKCIIELKESYRFSESGGIGLLAEAINNSNENLALEILKSKKYSDVHWVQNNKENDKIIQIALEKYSKLLKLFREKEQVCVFNKFRILCAHKQDKTGTLNITEELEKHLYEQGLIDNYSSYKAKPIIITKNDYVHELYNGDTGVFLSNDTVLFDKNEETRIYNLAELRQYETAYALTIHKSQGSEFDEVLLSLPTYLSPILSRQLLYTAITRAKNKLTIIADENIIRHCIKTSAYRVSGLGYHLWDNDKISNLQRHI